MFFPDEIAHAREEHPSCVGLLVDVLHVDRIPQSVLPELRGRPANGDGTCGTQSLTTVTTHASVLLVAHLTETIVETVNPVRALPNTDLAADTLLRIPLNPEISIGLIDGFEKHRRVSLDTKRDSSFAPFHASFPKGSLGPQPDPNIEIRNKS
jgi:hypothetical protein